MRPVCFLLTLSLTLTLRAADPPQPTPAPPKPAPRLRTEAMRNENVAVYLIDTNAAKEANVRLGNRVQILTESPVEVSTFAGEQGNPPSAQPFLAPPAKIAARHGELYPRHQNSVFNARAFFQVGGVKPSRQNSFGGRLTGSLGPLGNLTVNLAQRAVRGMVNGNVLVPLLSERSPLTPDPAKRAWINRIFAAYPAEAPNRLDFDPRALNTNSPQRIDATDFDLRLDKRLAGNDLSAFYSRGHQQIDAFQLVAGQNPDTTLQNHTARLTWRRAPSSTLNLQAGITVQRNVSLLVSPPGAVGPRVRFGYQIEELGPDSTFPVDRAQNSFRYGFGGQKIMGRHTLTFGGDATRYQLNGIEANNLRGYYQFANNFGRTAIENLRYGDPTNYEITLGSVSRGFRNWSGQAYVALRSQLHPRLQLYLGLRYSPDGAPYEVNNREPIPYPCDCNNLAPRFSLAWRATNAWTARAMYAVSFSPVPPVAYGQVRNNPPNAQYIFLQNPDLLNPLTTATNFKPSLHTLDPGLVSAYAHQYSLRLERRWTNNTQLRLGYIGSRSFKLPYAFVENRAVFVPGIAPTTGNIDQRRPDPSINELRRVVNAGTAWYDGAQAALDLPSRRGLLVSAVYTFGKGLDNGSDYTATAANKDMLNARPQSMFNMLADRKGLSNFDSTHAFSLQTVYDLPHAFQLSGVGTLKTGTPLTLFIGSDAPGIGNVDGSGGERPNILDPSILGRTIGNPDTAALILRRDRFSYIPVGEDRGNLGRGTFRKGGIFNWNAALQRNWKLPRDGSLQFRAEAYNATNTPQFDEPQRNVTSPAFGKITNTLNDGRVFQLGIRIVL
ncbi:MAG: TonB-dependent receptor domain-containing protein [Acidobacteriota bacterium]